MQTEVIIVDGEKTLEAKSPHGVTVDHSWTKRAWDGLGNVVRDGAISGVALLGACSSSGVARLILTGITATGLGLEARDVYNLGKIPHEVYEVVFAKRK